MEDRKGVISAVRNPLSIIALFLLLVEVVVTIALRVEVLTEPQRTWLVVFCVVFPVIVLLFLFILVWNRPQHLYGPSDYDDPSKFIDSLTRVKYLSRVNELELESGRKVRDPLRRRELTQMVIDAENLAVSELEKEFRCKLDREVLSAERNYRYDAVIPHEKGSIGVETYYMPDKSRFDSFAKRIERFEKETPELPIHLIAFVTDSPIFPDIQLSIKQMIEDRDKPFLVRFYSFEALPSADYPRIFNEE